MCQTIQDGLKTGTIKLLMVGSLKAAFLIVIQLNGITLRYSEVFIYNFTFFYDNNWKA